MTKLRIPLVIMTSASLSGVYVGCATHTPRSERDSVFELDDGSDGSGSGSGRRLRRGQRRRLRRQFWQWRRLRQRRRLWIVPTTITTVPNSPPLGSGALCSPVASRCRSGCSRDDDHVYWVNVGNNGDGSVMRVAKSGGAPQILASGQQFPVGLVVDDDAGLLDHGRQRIRGQGTVMRVSKTGGAPVALATGLNFPSDLEGDDDAVFWRDEVAGVERVAKRGGAVQVLHASQSVGRDLAVDRHRVYFYDAATAELLTVPTTGGTAAHVASVPGPGVASLTVHDGTLYWHDDGVGSLWHVRATGGTPRVLFTENAEMGGLVVTSRSVFFAQVGQIPQMPPGPGVIHQITLAGEADTAVTPPGVGKRGCRGRRSQRVLDQHRRRHRECDREIAPRQPRRRCGDSRRRAVIVRPG